VGLYKLNAVDPELESAWFQPLNLKCDILVFTKFAFLTQVVALHPVPGIAPRFTKSAIKSSAALTYAEAQNMMDDAGDDSPLTKDLRGINKCARALRAKRIEAGALTLASPEVRFELDKETSDPLDVGMYVTREANQMVEEMMLLANVASAEAILKAYPSHALLRRHPTPAPRMFDPLLKACAAVGVAVDVSSSRALADSLDGRGVSRGLQSPTCSRLIPAVLFEASLLPLKRPRELPQLSLKSSEINVNTV
jgi:hypothetical protein